MQSIEQIFRGKGLTDAYEIVRSIGFTMRATGGFRKPSVYQCRLDVIRHLGATDFDTILWTSHQAMPAMVPSDLFNGKALRRGTPDEALAAAIDYLTSRR